MYVFAKSVLVFFLMIIILCSLSGLVYRNSAEPISLFDLENAVNTSVKVADTSTLPSNGWNVTYGGPDSDDFYSGIQTSDGGYAMIGYSVSLGGTWLVKTDSIGEVEWENIYLLPARNNSEPRMYPAELVQTPDDGYAVIGITNCFNTDKYDYSIWLMKVDCNGSRLWDKIYGGGRVFLGYRYSYDIITTDEGGLLLAGHHRYFVDIFPSHMDFWLIKTDSSGNVEWNRTYGKTDNDEDEVSYSVIQTVDGGYAIAGYKREPLPAQTSDIWLVKTDSSGNVEWDESYGKPDCNDEVRSLIQTSDGGFALAGFSWFPYDPDEDINALLIKTNGYGNLEWNNTYGLDGMNKPGWAPDDITEDKVYSVIQTSDGDYTMAGYSELYDRNLVSMIIVDADGKQKWATYYGDGDQRGIAKKIFQTADYGYVLIANYYHGDRDGWLIYIQPEMTPPVVSLVSPINNSAICSGQDIYIYAEEPESEISSILYSWDSYPTDTSSSLSLTGPWSKIPSPSNWKIYAPDDVGVHWLYVHAQNFLGYQKAYRFKFDIIDLTNLGYQGKYEFTIYIDGEPFSGITKVTRSLSDEVTTDFGSFSNVVKTNFSDYRLTHPIFGYIDVSDMHSHDTKSGLMIDNGYNMTVSLTDQPALSFSNVYEYGNFWRIGENDYIYNEYFYEYGKIKDEATIRDILTYEGNETVTTGAGKFSCMRYKTESYSSGDARIARPRGPGVISFDALADRLDNEGYIYVWITAEGLEVKGETYDEDGSLTGSFEITSISGTVWDTAAFPVISLTGIMIAMVIAGYAKKRK